MFSVAREVGKRTLCLVESVAQDITPKEENQDGGEKTLFLANGVDLSDEIAVKKMCRELVEKAAQGDILLDFTDSTMPISAIVTIVFIALKELKKKKIKRNLALKASFEHHRSLITAGVNHYVELRLVD